ncbi:MAG: lipoprotein [Pseudomonadales bacterium]|jgi:predicted small lipoprotein YifL
MKRLLLILAIGTFALVGCGQKGPLYLPQADEAPKQEPEAGNR